MTQNDVKLNKNTTKKTKRISNTDPTTKHHFIIVLYTAIFYTKVVVLSLCFPTLIVPVLIIAWIKFTSSVWLIDNSGTVVRGTARPGTRETPASLKA